MHHSRGEQQTPNDNRLERPVQNPYPWPGVRHGFVQRTWSLQLRYTSTSLSVSGPSPRLSASSPKHFFRRRPRTSSSSGFLSFFVSSLSSRSSRSFAALLSGCETVKALHLSIHWTTLHNVGYFKPNVLIQVISPRRTPRLSTHTYCSSSPFRATLAGTTCKLLNLPDSMFPARSV